jgi:hypothetical protein
MYENVCWDVALYSLVQTDRHFIEAYCLIDWLNALMTEGESISETSDDLYQDT